MKRLSACLFAFACLASAAAEAKVYYINAGVRYHVGDGKSALSGDALFVGTYPLVGQQWVEGFHMDRRDRVRVNIRRLWGVDDCPYCKDLVWLDNNLIGRLDSADNKTGFATPEPLNVVLDAGDHRVMIESVGLDQADDFVMEGVSVESDRAEVILMQPGPVLKSPTEPMPPLFVPETTVGPCGDLLRQREWIAGWSAGRGKPVALASGDEPSTSPALLGLAKGSYCSLQVAFVLSPGSGRLGQALKILVGDGDGWDLQFKDGRSAEHGNMVRGGDYTAESFPSPDWHAGWNLVELRRCRDGSVGASVNGRDLGPTVDAGGAEAEMRVQSLGLGVYVRPAP